MRTGPPAGDRLALGGAARADTLTEITTHGMVVTIADMDIDIAFPPDGKYTGMAGALTGTWKIDGDKLCTTSNFDLIGPQGAAKMKIK